jgi:hypothetical protein
MKMTKQLERLILLMQVAGVFVGTSYVRGKLSLVTGMKWWFMMLFSFALFGASIYEISVKPVLLKQKTFKALQFELLFIWILPFLAGYLIMEI